MPSRKIAGDTILYPGILRAQVSFDNVSALPRDRFVNTFHFAGAMSQANVNAIGELLQHFYNDTPGTAVPAPAEYLSPVIAGASLRVYDLGETDPRTPHVPDPSNLWWQSWRLTGGTALPNEVAVCVSYYTDKNAPRKRGRFYLGALNTKALGGTTGAPADQTVKSELRQVLAGNAFTLASQLTHPGLEWVLLSPKLGGSSGPVQHGWVDNSFDTIRKRGMKTTARTVW
jgi:hypothetical protein